MAMESLIGFTGATTTSDVVEQSCGYKLVPWLSFDEWDSVRDSLFSSSPPSIASALQRITAWRSRGCLPVVIEVTASIVEIQQKDPYFRADLSDDGSDSEEMLSMLYCMAIMSGWLCIMEVKLSSANKSMDTCFDTECLCSRGSDRAYNSAIF